MITSIVTGSGRNRQSFSLPVADGSPPPAKDAKGKTYGNAPQTGRIPLTKDAKAERIAIGNKIKSIFLWPNGRGFAAAKARGLAAVSA